jgi:hypothetical protein
MPAAADSNTYSKWTDKHSDQNEYSGSSNKYKYEYTGRADKHQHGYTGHIYFYRYVYKYKHKYTGTSDIYLYGAGKFNRYKYACASCINGYLYKHACAAGKYKHTNAGPDKYGYSHTNGNGGILTVADRNCGSWKHISYPYIDKRYACSG